MQSVIWCVICGIITAGSLCAALGAEKRAREAEKEAEVVWDRLHKSEANVRFYVKKIAELETELAKKQKVLDYIADAEKEDAV